MGDPRSAMHYLYGDSTPSPLTANFLEFLRDALDFAVFVLVADEKIKAGRSLMRFTREENDAETERLQAFIATVQKAIDVAEKGAELSPTSKCAAQLKETVATAERNATAGIRSDTASAIEHLEAEEAAIRAECLQALATLLVPHDPPDATAFTRIALTSNGTYEGTRAAKAEFGLEWTLELAIPEGIWSPPGLRVERLVPHLEIRAPQLSGWISKEVKTKPQRLERMVVTELTMEGEASRIRLRTEPNIESGFDIVVDKGSVKASRIAPTEEGANGPFELHPDDYALLADLATKLRASTKDFERRTLISATTEDLSFEAIPTFVTFVERLIAMMAPIVREIDVRSLTRDELVMRLPLSDDRREEIFVTKSTLREKYGGLASDLRVMFAPLRLEDVPPQRPPPPPSQHPPSLQPPSSRSEIPIKSVRPPPPPPPVRKSSTLPPPGAVPPPANPPSPSPAPPVVETLEVDDEPSPLPPPNPPPKRPSSRPPPSERERNEALVAALKKIFTLARAGRVEEAYKKYAELYSSDVFASYKPEEQREALKVMVHAKSHPTNSEAVVEAHRAALARIKALVDAHAEPVDYEMLGMTHLQLSDQTAATSAFEIALKLERTRNPQSSLSESLAKRLSP